MSVHIVPTICEMAHKPVPYQVKCPESMGHVVEGARTKGDMISTRPNHNDKGRLPGTVVFAGIFLTCWASWHQLVGGSERVQLRHS